MSDETSNSRERIGTWAALLAHWTRFAQAAVALPRDVQGDRWRASVPSIIGLQAVTMALGELEQLRAADPVEGAVGADRAAVLIREYSAILEAAWNGATMPVGVTELMQDAATALHAVRSGEGSA